MHGWLSAASRNPHAVKQWQGWRQVQSGVAGLQPLSQVASRKPRRGRRHRLKPARPSGTTADRKACPMQLSPRLPPSGAGGATVASARRAPRAASHLYSAIAARPNCSSATPPVSIHGKHPLLPPPTGVISSIPAPLFS